MPANRSRPRPIRGWVSCMSPMGGIWPSMAGPTGNSLHLCGRRWTITPIRGWCKKILTIVSFLLFLGRNRLMPAKTKLLAHMHFQLSEEHQMIQKAARDFARTECLPGVIERDEHQKFPKEQVLKLAELGF